MQRTLLGADITAILLSLLYLLGGLSYSMGTLDQPGPGLYPLFVGILLLIASVGSLVTHVMKPAKGNLEWPKGKDLWRVVVVTAGAISYVVFLPYLGHLLASMVAIFIVLHTMGLSSWPLKIGFTVAIALGSFYLFDVILNVPLPRGVFG